jgi:hypothetical protein
VTIHEPSWIRVLNGFGLPAGRAENGEELAICFSSWNPDEGPLFVEIPFDPKGYQDMVKGIR